MLFEISILNFLNLGLQAALAIRRLDYSPLILVEPNPLFMW